MANQTTREFRDFRIRRKADTGTADPARWAYVDGNSFVVTFGGTETNGTYIITIVPSAAGVATIPITVTRTAGSPATNTLLAAAAVTNTNTLLAAGTAPTPTALATYIESVSSSGAATQFIAKRDAPPFTVLITGGTALVAAGGAGTLALSPNDTFPITFDTLGYGPQVGARTKLEVTLIPVNSSGVPLDPGTAVMDLTVRRMIERDERDHLNRPRVAVAVGSAEIQEDLPLGQPFRIDGGGGRYAFALGAIGGGAITGLDAVEVWAREVTS